MEDKGFGHGPNQWKIVYQSGHGTVFCNKDRHFWLTGEFMGSYPLNEFPEDYFDSPLTIRFGKCDCEKYR